MKEPIAHSGSLGPCADQHRDRVLASYRYLAPKTWRECASAGVVRAFIIALCAEIYGFFRNDYHQKSKHPNKLTIINPMGMFEHLFRNFSRRGYGSGHHGGGHQNYPAPGAGYPPPGSAPLRACPKCAKPNTSDARFCQHCGVSLVAGVCGKCHAQLTPGAKFCPGCGAATAS